MRNGALSGIYIDAGTHDEVYLDLGAAAFAAELERAGISYHLEFFDAGHGAIEYRYPMALKYLTEKLVS